MNLTLSAVNILGAVILLCAFLQLSQRRLITMLKLNQIAALALSAGAFWQGFAQQAWPLYGVGALVLVVQAVALPRMLRQMVRLFGMPVQIEGALPVLWAMLVGLLPVILAALAVLPVIKTSLPPISGNVGVALGVLLLGLWLVVVHGQALAQIIGFIMLGDGLVFGLINAPGVAWVVDVAVMALLGIEAGLILLAYWRYKMPQETRTNGVGS